MIDNLNALPSEVLEEARHLQGLQQYKFLLSRTSKRNHPFLESFISDVVEGRQNTVSWRRGGVLVPERRLAEILQISAAEILSPLDAPGNIGWQRVAVPSGSRTRDPYVGAPATRHDEIDYLWFPKENATRIALAAAVLEPVTRPEVAVRRWIAHRTAIVLRATSHRFTDIADIARALDINVSLLSADAIAALRGLIAESHGDLENEATFGFSGPDSLYE